MIICGVDEAGRGPLAGPVYAAAVILRDGGGLDGLTDSKKLTAKKREYYYGAICASAVDHAVASASVGEIESMNILEASLLAMRRAVGMLRVRPDLLLIDGNIARGFEIPAEAVVKGDSKHLCISAASVLAKVARDTEMAELDKRFPQYGFAGHKGYGTAAHIKAIREHGACAEHRASFLRGILNA
jgi:ribonuclease HII